jgi:hypothetical protein
MKARDGGRESEGREGGMEGGDRQNQLYVTNLLAVTAAAVVGISPSDIRIAPAPVAAR